MPFYEYQCNACGHEFEELQKVLDKPIRKCPKCGKLKVQKLVSAAGFQLKGTGWYETDFKNKKKPEPKGEAKTESKTHDAKATDKTSKDSSVKSQDKKDT